MKRITCLALMLALLCGAAFGMSDKRIEQIEKLSCDRYPCVTYGELYNSLSPEEKAFLVGQMKKLLLSQLPPDFIQTASAYMEQAGASEYKIYLEQILAFLKSDNNDDAVQILDNMNMDDPILVDPALFRIYHEKMAPSSSLEAVHVEQVPAYIKKDFQVIDKFNLLDSSEGLSESDFPKTKFKALHSSNGRELGKLSQVADLPAHVMHNSIQLANALNQLSNVDSTTDIYKEIDLSILGGENQKVKNPMELINTLWANEGLEIVGYEARMGVDFLGIHIRQGGNLVSVEIPSFMLTELDEKAKVPMPSNHCEHLIAIYKKGEDTPLALVKWYMGIPTDNQLIQGTIWKPAFYMHSPWCGFKLTHKYSKQETITKMVEVARYMMKTYNYVQWNSDFPMNGYGILSVCNDSVALMETILDQCADYVPWPNIRSVKLDPLYGEVLSRFGGLKLEGGYLNCMSDVYPDIYAGASVSVNYRIRLVMNLPFRSKNQIIGKSFLDVYEKIESYAPGSFASEVNKVITD